jgi:predicted NBD/HSP70 family sugar kinase
VLEAGTVADGRVRDGVVVAVATAIASMIALLNPSAVVIGGPWSNAADFSVRLQERVQEIAVVETMVRPALLGSDAPLTGARITAVRSAQRRLLDSTVSPYEIGDLVDRSTITLRLVAAPTDAGIQAM